MVAKCELAIFLGLQTLWPYSLKKPDFADFGCSSGQVISKIKSVTPHFCDISDMTNSSCFNGKMSSKKSISEKFGANVLKTEIQSSFSSQGNLSKMESCQINSLKLNLP